MQKIPPPYRRLKLMVTMSPRTYEVLRAHQRFEGEAIGRVIDRLVALGAKFRAMRAKVVKEDKNCQGKKN